MPNTLFLDFETRSPLDLSVVGLDNYSRQADVLMLGWALDDRKVRLWFPEDDMPEELQSSLADLSTTKIAWNAQFERAIFKQVLGRDIPIEQWKDAMVLARHMSLPGSLESVCEILKVGKDEGKLKDGKRLIKLFCEPNGTKGQETLFGVSDGFANPREHVLDWKQFQEYCIRDVEIERTLFRKMEKLSFPEEQWADWHLDQKINECGIPVNTERARKALSLAERYKKESREKLNQMTGLANANSRDQLLPWLQERGYVMGSLMKNYVEWELKSPQSKLTPEAREVLLLRQKSSQNSYTKVKKLLTQTGPDGRLRYQFSFLGAARTGRWSSAGINVQNFPRPIKKVEKWAHDCPEKIFDLIDREAYDEILKEFDGSTLPFAASVIRMLIEVPNN